MNVPPKIIDEKHMADMDGTIFDYSFFCFNSVPKFVWVVMEVELKSIQGVFMMLLGIFNII